MRKIDSDTTKKDNMEVETMEEINQNMNGRNSVEMSTIEAQNTTETYQNMNHSNEEEMIAENHKNGCTLHVTKNLKKDWSDAESVYETLLVVNKTLNVQKKEEENFDVVDKHDKRTEIEENWSCGVRTTGQ